MKFVEVSNSKLSERVLKVAKGTLKKFNKKDFEDLEAEFEQRYVSRQRSFDRRNRNRERDALITNWEAGLR